MIWGPCIIFGLQSLYQPNHCNFYKKIARMRIFYYIIGFVIITVSGFIIGRILSSFAVESRYENMQNAGNGGPENTQIIEGIISSVRTIDPRKDINTSREGSIKIGNTGTEIIVFTDVTCRYCAKFNLAAKELAKTGKYQFSIRHRIKHLNSQAVQKHRTIECGNLLNISEEIILSETYDLSMEAITEKIKSNINDPYTFDEFTKCLHEENDLGERVSLILRGDSLMSKTLNITAVPSWIVNKQIGVGHFPTSVMD